MNDGTSKYPFSAIVGQERMKTALILNIVNPAVGGVLIRGEKGTAKSTAVRSLSRLLPRRTVIEACRCNCSADTLELRCGECEAKNVAGAPVVTTKPMEVVELPLNATEDRVAGTIDIETALREGVQRFEPGVLARANGNILYVDEVNLLDDHIVDMLLDAAAMGVNNVEREGISFRHQSRFVLVGTMNPEEGDIRPQLLDRFGIVVDVHAERDIEQRVEVVRRRLAFDADPDSFVSQWKTEENELGRKISAAIENRPSVLIDPALLRLAAEICIEAGVDGHRADITVIHAATARSAFRGDRTVTRDDILEAAALALPHRTRRRPFEESSFEESFLEKWR